jgi:hypothetical protein
MLQLLRALKSQQLRYGKFFFFYLNIPSQILPHDGIHLVAGCNPSREPQ